MKYIAFYGAHVVCVLCAVCFGTLIMAMAQNHAGGLIEVIAMMIAIPVVCFIAIASAWIVCDMKKRMKDL